VVLHIAARTLARFDASALQALECRRVNARGCEGDRARRRGLREEQARWMLPLTAPVMLQAMP